MELLGDWRDRLRSIAGNLHRQGRETGAPDKKTLLVVDDDVPFRRAISFDFKKRGFVVLEAPNGRDAFELVKKQKIDAIISDIRMPGGDGIELLANVKSLDPLCPSVVLITGYADVTAEEVYDKGASAFFAKPFVREDLFEAVLRAITPKTELWSLPSDASSQSKIEIEFSDFQEAIQSGTLKFGRGGLFIAHEETLPPVDSEIVLNITFAHGEPRALQGTGIVRWVRYSSVENLAAGCGIEFLSLEEKTREIVLKITESLKSAQFIPRI